MEGGGCRYCCDNVEAGTKRKLPLQVIDVLVALSNPLELHVGKRVRVIARETTCQKSHECDGFSYISGHGGLFLVATRWSLGGCRCLNGNICATLYMLLVDIPKLYPHQSKCAIKENGPSSTSGMSLSDGPDTDGELRSEDDLEEIEDVTVVRQ